MKKLLEQAKSLVAMVEEKIKSEDSACAVSNKVQLSELAVGEKFNTEIGKFIVLDHIGDEAAVITKDLFLEDKPFGDSPDYKTSDIRKLCDGEILEKFEKAFGADNIIEHEVDLTTVDMQKNFGSLKCKVRPIAFDEAREYNELLVNKDLPDWYWTCTPWSTKERGWQYSIAVVSPGGFIYGNSYDYDIGVRPFCILKSDIFVSKGE